MFINPDTLTITLTEVEKEQERRFHLLYTTYQMCNHDRKKSLKFSAIAKASGIDDKYAEILGQYLFDEGLIAHTIKDSIEHRYIAPFMGVDRKHILREWRPHDLPVAITHQGLKEVEQVLSKKSTEHFSQSTVNYITINNQGGTMGSPTVQQGNINSRLTITINQDHLEELNAILEELAKIIADTRLSEAARSELKAEQTTLKSQAESPKPKLTIIKEGLSSMKEILSNAKEIAALSAPIISRIAALLSGLG